jgi:hypothetical protein
VPLLLLVAAAGLESPPPPHPAASNVTTTLEATISEKAFNLRVLDISWRPRNSVLTNYSSLASPKQMEDRRPVATFRE